MITAIEDYFANGCGRCDRFATPECSARQWAGGLREIRRICLGLPLVETVKWAHPCYMYAGRNIVIVGATRSDLRISFFDAALMQDPEGVLERQGPHTRHPDTLRFTESAQVAAREAIIRAYLAEAMGYAQAGITAPKQAAAMALPDELTEALEADRALAAAFHALTPGRQRSYVIHLSSAKKAETRISRIAALRGRILTGKGASER